MAGLPESVLGIAKKQAEALESEMDRRKQDQACVPVLWHKQRRKSRRSQSDGDENRTRKALRLLQGVMAEGRGPEVVALARTMRYAAE